MRYRFEEKGIRKILLGHEVGQKDCRSALGVIPSGFAVFVAVLLEGDESSKFALGRYSKVPFCPEQQWLRQFSEQRWLQQFLEDALSGKLRLSVSSKKPGDFYVTIEFEPEEVSKDPAAQWKVRLTIALADTEKDLWTWWTDASNIDNKRLCQITACLIFCMVAQLNLPNMSRTKLLRYAAKTLWHLRCDEFVWAQFHLACFHCVEDLSAHEQNLSALADILHLPQGLQLRDYAEEAWQRWLSSKARTHFEEAVVGILRQTGQNTHIMLVNCKTNALLDAQIQFVCACYNLWHWGFRAMGLMGLQGLKGLLAIWILETQQHIQIIDYSWLFLLSCYPQKIISWAWFARPGSSSSVITDWQMLERNQFVHVLGHN